MRLVLLLTALLASSGLLAENESVLKQKLEKSFAASHAVVNQEPTLEKEAKSEARRTLQIQRQTIDLATVNSLLPAQGNPESEEINRQRESELTKKFLRSPEKRAQLRRQVFLKELRSKLLSELTEAETEFVQLLMDTPQLLYGNNDLRTEIESARREEDYISPVLGDLTHERRAILFALLQDKTQMAKHCEMMCVLLEKVQPSLSKDEKGILDVLGGSPVDRDLRIYKWMKDNEKRVVELVEEVRSITRELQPKQDWSYLGLSTKQ